MPLHAPSPSPHLCNHFSAPLSPDHLSRSPLPMLPGIAGPCHADPGAPGSRQEPLHEAPLRPRGCQEALQGPWGLSSSQPPAASPSLPSGPIIRRFLLLCQPVPPPTAKVKGEIRYNGEALDNFVVERTAAYVDQVSRSATALFLLLCSCFPRSLWRRQSAAPEPPSLPFICSRFRRTITFRPSRSSTLFSSLSTALQ